MEHLLDGWNILQEILQQAPDIKLLLTSRTQVQLQWEWIIELQGLHIPETLDASILTTNSAAILFQQRARQAAQGFSLGDEDAAALVQIIKLEDVLPLAIELAAAWVHIQTSLLIQAETTNWISAWHWCVQNQRLALLRQVVPCLYWYYEIHGYYAEALPSYQLAVTELRAAGAPHHLRTPEEKSAFAFLVDQSGWL